MTGRIKRDSPWRWPLTALVAILFIVLLGTIVALMTGCSAGVNDEYPNSESSDSELGETSMTERKFFLSDGRELTCVIIQNDVAAISCDWGSANWLSE